MEEVASRMSDLKYRTLAQLYMELDKAVDYRNLLKSRIGGQDTRIYWIKHYIERQHDNIDISSVKLGDRATCADKSCFVVQSIAQDGAYYLLNGRRYNKLGVCVEAVRNSHNIVALNSEK